MKEVYFQQAVIRNINKQKQKINNEKKYAAQEKALLLKGLNMAIDRVNTAYKDKRYRELVGLPEIITL